MESNLPLYEFTTDEHREWYETLQIGYPIPDPNKELIEIYEIDTLVQALGIRAEKWDSPEWKKTPEFREILAKAEIAAQEKRKEAAESKITIHVQGEEVDSVQIPRNLQNPNYTKLLKKIESLRDEKTVEAFNDLKSLVESYICEAERGVGQEHKGSGPGPEQAREVEGTLPIYRLNWVPDVRFLRVRLSKHDINADRSQIIGLILSYLRSKYVVET